MKPEVEAKVSEALSQLWIPIMYSVGIDEIHIDDNEDRRRVLDEYPRIDDEQWGNLVDTVKRKLGDVASVSYENRSLSICLPTVKLFGKCINIEINRESTENLSPINEFEFNEFEDMTKEGAIEYIENCMRFKSHCLLIFYTQKHMQGHGFILYWITTNS